MVWYSDHVVFSVVEICVDGGVYICSSCLF